MGIKILLSLVFGILIGLERERCGKSVGMRTVSLICIGATLFCLMSPNMLDGDNSRVVAQIVSGIGFLGAGIIFKNGDSVHGLTTAATIWAAAAVGSLVGLGMFLEAFLGTAVILIINLGFRYVKTKTRRSIDRTDEIECDNDKDAS